MSLIRQPYEIKVQAKIKALIYGQSGMGKTTLALSAPSPLLLDTDNGIHRVNSNHWVPTVQVQSYNDVLDTLNREDLTPYQTIIIDTGDKLLDFMAQYIIAKNQKMGKTNGSLTLQGYGERKQEFKQFCKLVSGLGKHLVFVAQRETKQEGDNIRYVPLFGGSNYDSLVTELDLVGYLEANGRNRMLTFDGTDRNDGKNTCCLPPLMQLPTVVDENGFGLKNTFLNDSVINPYLNNIEKSKKIGQKYQEVVDELKENILLITDSQSANDFIGRIDAFDHIGSSKAIAGKMLSDKAKELGLKYNKEMKIYEQVC